MSFTKKYFLVFRDFFLKIGGFFENRRPIETRKSIKIRSSVTTVVTGRPRGRGNRLWTVLSAADVFYYHIRAVGDV